MSTNTPKILHDNQIVLLYSDKWLAFHYKVCPEEKSPLSRQPLCATASKEALQWSTESDNCSAALGSFIHYVQELGSHYSRRRFTSLAYLLPPLLPLVGSICYQANTAWSFTNQAAKFQRKQPSFCKPISCPTVEPCRQKSIFWTDTLVMLLTSESQDFILIPDSYPSGEAKLTPPVSKLLTLALWLALTLTAHCFS